MKIKKETKTVEYEDLCFGDVFEIDGKFFMKANDCGYWKAVALDNGRIYKESLLRSKKREEYKNKKKDKEMRIV